MLCSLLGLLLVGCASSKKYTLGSVKTFDPDTSKIAQPVKLDQSRYWDRINSTVFQQIKKPLNLNKVGRSAGQILGVADAREADNINVLDEPPESSWYTYRHFYDAMTLQELARGPNSTTGPDVSGMWKILEANLDGANSGFIIEDGKGERYRIKFDGYEYPELRTSAEVISTKFFYASGYSVPEAVITYFDPEIVVISEDAKVSVPGKNRNLTMEDFRQIIENRPRNNKGEIRAIASKFTDGTPVGPWGFDGTRSDDPNDRVAHEHRRELRGMRVLSSWLDDTNRSDANTMAVFTDQGYIKHYVQNFGNTLGANGYGIRSPIYGQAYLIDPRYMALNAMSLGMNVNIWETIDVDPSFTSVGYFRSDFFEPGRWVPGHPLAAFENMTLRDAYWGAKLVMSFSDDDIRSIVRTGKLTNTEAEAYLSEVLIERRDKVGKYWLRRINPLDKFEATAAKDVLQLKFKDLGIDGRLFDSDLTRYRYEVYESGKLLQSAQNTRQPLAEFTKLSGLTSSPDNIKVLRFKIYTLRPDTDYKAVEVYVALKQSGPGVVGIQRD